MRIVQETSTRYNLPGSSDPMDAAMVMYKVNAPLPISKFKKGFTPSQV
jgi:hypothetical protein